MDQIRAWEREILKLILEGKTPDENQVDMFGGLALLSADVDKVKEYVFESAKLPEVRGASMILDELNRGWPRDCHETIRQLFADKGFDVDEANEASCIIYAGGGSLLAVAPLDVANELQSEIEVLYPRETGLATITCVVRPISISDLQPKHALKERLEALEKSLPPAYRRRLGQAQNEVRDLTPFARSMHIQAVELRRRKEERAAAPLFEEVAYGRRCDSCGRRPANIFESVPEARYLCKVCARKAGGALSGEAGSIERKARKSRWHQEFEKHVGAKVNVPQDLNAIGETSNGYVGFVYADGDGVGSRLEASASLSEYRKRSVNLTRTMTKAVFLALDEHLRNQDGSIRLFEIITIGGDDALLIVPADTALSVARSLCNTFCDSLDFTLWDGESPTMSAGVVIAHQDNPVNFLFNTAQELLKSAKRKSHEMGQGAVDFLVFKSQTMLSTSLTHLRSSSLWAVRTPDTKERLFLTARPYTLENVEKLLQSSRLLAQGGFGQSWLKNLAFNLRRGRLAASIFYLYQYARLPAQRQETLERLHEIWKMGPKHGRPHDIPPWRFRGTRGNYEEFETPWLDIIEVMEFLPEGKGG